MTRLNTQALEILDRILSGGGFVWEAAQVVADELGPEQRDALVAWMRGTLKAWSQAELEQRKWNAVQS